jgi:hypothetical protein
MLCLIMPGLLWITVHYTHPKTEQTNSEEKTWDSIHQWVGRDNVRNILKKWNKSTSKISKCVIVYNWSPNSSQNFQNFFHIQSEYCGKMVELVALFPLVAPGLSRWKKWAYLVVIETLFGDP